MKYQLGSLSESALSKFVEYLDSSRNGATDEPPYYLLEGDENVTPILFSTGTVEVDGGVEISTRMDLGRYLSGLIATDEDLSKVLDDRGAGAFLAILFFERICNKKADGSWEVLANDRYIPNLRLRTRFYRHLVQSPLSIFKLHGEMGRLYLCQPAHIHPETMEQIASREDLILNPNVIELADRLYWDDEGQSVKVNAADNDPVQDGGLLRFVGPGSFTDQFGAVYDFWTMSADEISRLLPRPEFNRWLG